MPRIDVRGHVRYDNLTSVTGSTVTLRDLDRVPLVPGNEDDLILTTTTDARGRFAGRTTDWQDREGRVAVVDVPDVLRLEFAVTVGGRTHRGPFLQHDGASVPIVLPFGPRRPVARAKRELVQVILLADRPGADRALYEFIELSSETLTRSILADRYARTTFVTGPDATVAGVTGALRTAATRPGIEAVDLLFTTHGNNNKVSLADGKITDTELATAITTELPAAAERRLRTVFSTACFGRSHLESWLAAGFTDASGARGVYADSAVSYAPFLTAWAAEATFAEAVDAANAADVGDAADRAARAFYEARDEPGDARRAAAIDSTRVRAGTGASRLYTTP